MVEIICQTTPKPSPEIGLRLPYIYLRRYMHDFFMKVAYNMDTARIAKLNNIFSGNLGQIMPNFGMSTLFHSCGFSCQQRPLKTFLGSTYLHSGDWEV